MSGNESRLQAIYQISNREPMLTSGPGDLEDIWGRNVFSLVKMKECLPKDVFKSLKETIETASKLDSSAADVVAQAMKDWALSKGALYYAHVFYPLTGATAEKHDSFISPEKDGSVIAEFSGKALIQGEPDASSFPNGGIRSTFEARGYTAWDVTSPAYIMESENGATLCIPTVFVSWTGEALDKKTPVLRSTAAMDKAANRVLKLFGHKDISPLSSSCGAEQEYFLVDTNFANARPDIVLAGKTLFGKPPAKGQQFDDHYFGAIPQRVIVFMQDVEQELYSLGIPAKTRHNEVAPGQYEIAPVFEAANVATDHQQLIMTTLKSVAKKHGFTCLLNEKPFKGINGSGKHVNWSVGNSTQGNLLDPGKTPNENAQFLVFCAAVIRGVHEYAPLMRAAIASAGNDHRLGANEAPPAIMSVYLGDQLADVFEQIAKGELKSSKEGGVMEIGVDSLPKLPKDAGDRNRTSPFAFTGNRFEFRAVGSNQSVAGPLVVLNTMLADSLNVMADKIEAGVKSGKEFNQTVQDVLKEIIEAHGAAIFNGDGYSEEWHKAAVEERGLLNIPTTADALPYLKDKKIIELFDKLNVLSPVELDSRYEIYSEQYILTIGVEADVVTHISKTLIAPATLRHLNDISAAASNLSEIGVEINKSSIEKVAELYKQLIQATSTLEEAKDKHDFDSPEAHMRYCVDTIRPLLEQVRDAADTLEGEVADDLWPLPSYHEMLFIR